MIQPLPGLGGFVVGSLLAALGLLALALSLFRRKGADPLLASFGAFSLLYGVRQIFSSPLTPTLGVTSVAAAWVVSLITYLIQIPAWAFFWQLLGSGWRSLVLWWLRLVSVFALVGVASDLIQRTPGTLARHPNNVLVITGLMVAAVVLWKSPVRRSKDLRIIIGGLVVFSVFVVNDNLVSMGLLPWVWREESVGFLLLVGCLGFVAARRFFATERDLATVEGELAAARRIQRSILPAGAPEIERLSIAVRFQPTSAVAGDLYDFLCPDEPGRLGVIVADVSGHGVPAALIASMVKMAVSSQRRQADRPARLLTEINRTLRGSFQHGFVTASYVFLDARSRRLTAASAGHPSPLLCRAIDGTVQQVGGAGPLLGRFADARYQEQTLAAAAGDRLVLYTDGIVETRSPGGEMFGEERLKHWIARYRTLPADDFCDRFFEELRRWGRARREVSPTDDLTLVVVDFDNGAGAARQPSGETSIRS